MNNQIVQIYRRISHNTPGLIEKTFIKGPLIFSNEEKGRMLYEVPGEGHKLISINIASLNVQKSLRIEKHENGYIVLNEEIPLSLIIPIP